MQPPVRENGLNDGAKGSLSGQYANVRNLFLFALIIAVFLFSRLLNLTRLPIFNDEAIYLRWAIMIRENPGDFLLPLRVDNSRPLLMWLTAIILPFFRDPLVAGRMVSIAAGFFCLAGMYTAGKLYHSRQAGYLAALLYALSPYHMLFDRMMSQASLNNCLFVWTVALTLRFMREGERRSRADDIAMSVVVALSFLNFATSILFLCVPLAGLIVFRKCPAYPSWKRLGPVYVAGVILGLWPYLALGIGGGFSLTGLFIPTNNPAAQRTLAGFVLGAPHVFAEGLGPVTEYFLTYLTPTLCLMAGVSFVFQAVCRRRQDLALLLFFAAGTIPLLLTCGAGFSRYYLFCSTPFLLWAAASMASCSGLLDKMKSQFARRVAAGVATALILLPMINCAAVLAVRPACAPLVPGDRFQYVTSEYSGYGIPETVQFLKTRAGGERIAVFCSSNWGNPSDAVYVYLHAYQNAAVHTADWVFDSPLLHGRTGKLLLSEKYSGRALGELDTGSLNRVYFVCSGDTFRREWFLRMNPDFRFLKSFGKPGNQSRTDVYESVRQ